MPITYCISAAGEGSRFKALFGETPKPLIRLSGICLLELSLRSLPISFGDRIIIITRKHHRVKDNLFFTIKSQYPFNEVYWQEIEELTKGQLETVYNAKEYFNLEDSLVIFNCDTYFQSHSLTMLMADKDIEGIIPCHKESGDCWSFCRTKSENDNLVVAVAEKVRISDWASVGLYYFKDIKKFLHFTEQELSNKISTEYFVAPLYNKYLANGERIVINRVDLFKPMGTPEQIEYYWPIKISDVIQQNQKKVLVVDLDNTITIDESHIDYKYKQANHLLICKLKEYKAKGYEIIVSSSRRMKTHNNDEAKLLAEIGDVTIKWLKEHDVPFDGLKFGKPLAENGFYIDDKAVRPNEFVNLTEGQILKLVKR